VGPPGGDQRRPRAGRDSWVSNATDVIQRPGAYVVSLEISGPPAESEIADDSRISVEIAKVGLCSFDYALALPQGALAHN
jgi:hypothetical protein